MAILIVGGDSRLSKVLLDIIQLNDDKAYRTTRTNVSTDEQI